MSKPSPPVIVLVEHQVELIRRWGSTVARVWLKAPRGVERFE